LARSRCVQKLPRDSDAAMGQHGGVRKRLRVLGTGAAAPPIAAAGAGSSAALDPEAWACAEE
jgi:hypothetical protein